MPASEYEFVFDGQTVVEPQKHGIHVLRANDICGPWTTVPRSPLTTPALHVVLDVSKETLRYDLWEVRFPQPRRLECIRWRLRDANSIQGLLAVSVME